MSKNEMQTMVAAELRRLIAQMPLAERPKAPAGERSEAAQSAAPAVVQQAAFPPVIGVAELSQLLRKSPGAIFADRTRAPHLLPPSCEPTGSKQPLWLLEDVLDWLRGFRRPAARAPEPEPLPVRHRGRPTKVEQLAREAAANALREMRGREVVQS